MILGIIIWFLMASLLFATIIVFTAMFAQVTGFANRKWNPSDDDDLDEFDLDNDELD